VPGHPIAGTEQSGAEAAFATLYPPETLHSNADGAHRSERPGSGPGVCGGACGSEVVVMDAEKHDRILAAISHLPHMVAYSLVNAVGSYDRYEENILEYSAGGFRDFTRIASSDPTMWRDIALTNRAALVEMMERFESVFAELKDDVHTARAKNFLSFSSAPKNCATTSCRRFLLRPPVRRLL
jgi:prephenate dehydrogenase